MIAILELLVALAMVAILAVSVSMVVTCAWLGAALDVAHGDDA